MTNVMDADMNTSLMEIHTRVSIWRGKLREKVSFIGLMVRSMMENGFQELRRGMESGKELMGTLILGNGRIVKLKDMEYTHGRMVIDMKVNGKLV